MKGKRIANGKKEYLIKWKGFTEDECTWEPVSNLEACAKMIAKYEKEHGMAEEKNEKPDKSDKPEKGGTSKSPKPEKKKLKGKDDGASEVASNKLASEPKKNGGKSSQIEEERSDSHFEVLKRTSIDSEIVFKVFDLVTKKEQFMSRKDLLKEDPVALCLFYEKHIVS